MHRLGLDREFASGKQGLAAQTAAGEEDRRNAETVARLEREREMLKAKTNAANAVARFNSVQDATGFGRTTPEDIVNNGGSDEQPNFTGL